MSSVTYHITQYAQAITMYMDINLQYITCDILQYNSYSAERSDTYRGALVRPQYGLEGVTPHLVEVPMHDTRAQERRPVHQLEKLDVVVAIQRRVGRHGQLDECTLPHLRPQLLALSESHNIHVHEM